MIELKMALDIYNEKPCEQWIFWVLGNEEAKALEKVIPNSVNVHGGLKPEKKAEYLIRICEWRS